MIGEELTDEGGEDVPVVVEAVVEVDALILGATGGGGDGDFVEVTPFLRSKSARLSDGLSWFNTLNETFSGKWVSSSNGTSTPCSVMITNLRGSGRGANRMLVLDRGCEW